mgnify:CR=1 FL=1
MTDPVVAPERKWVPALYVDEITPEGRGGPAEWIVPHGEGYALAPAEEDGNPIPLTEGEAIAFDWYEDHGTVVLLLHADGGHSLARPAPPEINAAMVVGDPETTCGSVTELVAELREVHGAGKAVEELICISVWSRRAESFVFALVEGGPCFRRPT